MPSISHQLQKNLFMTITVIVSLMTIAFTAIEIITFRQIILDSVVPRAEMLGIYLRRPLAQRETWSAQEVLATLSSDPVIKGAYLFDQKFQPVAFYRPQGDPGVKFSEHNLPNIDKEKILPLLESQSRHLIFSWKHLSIFVPIVHNNETIGTIYIINSLTPFYLRLLWWMIAATVATTIASISGLTLARRLQKRITGPISELATMMESVTNEGDLTPRAKTLGEGEIATLSRGFNQMLDSIAERDSELLSINFDLEGRIADRTQELRTTIEEKELLLREIHHRVKNNLQIISSLFSMQMRKITSPAAIEALQSSLSRIRSISLIHEKLYSPGQIAARHNLDRYLQELAEEIFRLHYISFKRIRLETDLIPLEIDFNQMIPLALILNELLTNTFKHAFSLEESGVVSIRLRHRGNQLILTVQDNGRGLPDNFILDAATTVGLRLTTNLIRQAKGQFHLLRSQPGTEAIVHYPLNAASKGGENGQSDSHPDR